MSAPLGSGIMRDIKRRHFAPFKKSKQLTKQVKNLDKRVKKLNKQAEVYHKDTFAAGQSISNTAVFVLLNDIAQGDTINTRTGNDISATSIQFRLSVENAATSATSNTIRMIVFWDQQANGVAPTVGELLDISTITTVRYAPYNSDNQKRFKILYDKTIVLVPKAGVSGTVVPDERYLRVKRKLSRVVKYDGTTAVIDSIASNSLYFMYVGDVSSLNPTITYGFRFNYKDG